MQISHVLLFLTYRCNLRCDFCLSFNSYWKVDSTLVLPSAVQPSLFLRAVRDFRELSTADVVERIIPQCEKNRVSAIALSGGEVLVRRDAAEIFRALGKSRMRWCLDSNLMLCNDAIGQAIVQSRCETVFVSLDGTREIHNKLRGNPQAFDRATAGIRSLTAARNAHAADQRTSVTINCVLQPGNESVPVDMVRLANEFGADELTFQLLSERSYNKPFDAKTAGSSLRSAVGLAGESGLRTSIYPLANPSERDLAAWFSTPASGQFFRGCTYIYDSLRIDPEGNVIPCLEYKLGNILEQELADIWNGGPYRAFRQGLSEKGPFRACLRCCNMKIGSA
jgi:MoaA/NifB/PqqE/SkfB family radical SAM enzyme